MKNQNSSFIQKLCLVLGMALLIASVAIFAWWQIGMNASRQQAVEYVHSLRMLLPQPEGAVPEARRDNTMPVLSLDGRDFVGILEMPRHSSSLPVLEAWGQVNKFPCRFSGSVYDKSLKIGATSQKGQFDFYRDISVGDLLYFTDMEGNRFAYSVSDIRYENHADNEALNRKDAALTLFIKNMHAFEYIIISCDVLT